MRYLFEVHSQDKMYTIMAAYFTADCSGVMFFDEKDNGIGFAPNTTLQLVRVSPPKLIDSTELMRAQSVLLRKDG